MGLAGGGQFSPERLECFLPLVPSVPLTARELALSSAVTHGSFSLAQISVCNSPPFFLSHRMVSLMPKGFLNLFLCCCCFKFKYPQAFSGIGGGGINSPIDTDSVLNQLRCSSKRKTAFHLSLLNP